MERRTQRNANDTRRVGNLTVEQAERKREIDRANQRYHRAKNKAYCRQLEQKLLDLTSRLREVEDLLTQCQCRERPAAGSANLAATTDLVSVPHVVMSELPSPALEAGYSEESFFETIPPDLDAGIIVNSLNSAHQFGFLNWNLSETINYRLPTTQTMNTGISTIYDPSATSCLGTVASGSDVPYWRRVPLHIPPTSKLDEVIQNITLACRNSLLHQPELTEPVFPIINSLLIRPDDNIKHFSDAVGAQVWRTPLEALPERIGFMYMLSHLLRWLVCRSKDAYDKMPCCLRPTVLQQTVPHAAWVDTIVWPEARDAIIRNMNWARFEEFRLLAGRTLTVRWPYDSSTSFIESPDKQAMLPHPMFEAHICKPDNWKLGEEVKQAFPFIPWDYVI